MEVKFLQESHIFANTEANIQKLPKIFQKCFLDSDINNEFSDGKRHSIKVMTIGPGLWTGTAILMP